MIEDFIRSARGQLRAGGEIHINVTQELLKKHKGVTEALGVPASVRFGDLARFGASRYYAPYRAYYTHGVRMKFYGWSPDNAKFMLNFVLK